MINSRTAPRILVVDDDPMFGNLLRRKAALYGMYADHVESLVDVLYEQYLERYDCAVIDCVMPGLDGFETTEYLHRFFRGLPVILVSRSESSFARYVAKPVGAVAFVSKIQGADAVLAAVRHAIEGRRRLRARGRPSAGSKASNGREDLK